MNLDFLKNLRLQNIFQGMQNPPDNTYPSYNPPVQPNPDPGLNTIADTMKQLYQPETGATDKFNQMVNQYPTMPEVGKGKKIAAALLAGTADAFGGGGGKETWDEMTGKTRFNENVNKWKNQIGPLQQSANLERQNNANERLVAHQQIADQLRQQAQDAKLKGDEVKNKIAQQKADAYEFKARNPGMKFDFTGPKVKVLDPTTGKITVTEFDTGNMSETDKINLQQQGKMEQIDAQGKNTNTVAETRGWKIGTIPDPNDPTKQIGVRYNEITGETVPIKVNGQSTTITTGNGKPPVDTQQAVKQKAQETLDALDEILDPKTSKLRESMTGAVGASRIYNAPFGYTLPGSQTKASDAAISRLKNMLTIELLGEMKAQSRTGATGFGQLSVKELGVLEGAASKLDPSLDEKTFETELNRIREKLKKVLQPSDGLNPTTTIRKSTAQELIRKYGG